MLADMVTRGSRVADVGCDHGFLSIYLVQQGISPGVLAMDVRKGPLTAAAEHIEMCGLGAYIETRLSDGLENYRKGEAETLVCAGMGGRLMAEILVRSMEKVTGFRELILQPQSELREFRHFLTQNGFRIEAENAVYEEGKYYFAMRAVCAGEGMDDKAENAAGRVGDAELSEEYGELLLRERHPVLKQYLFFRKEVTEQLIARLAAEDTERTKQRRTELEAQLYGIKRALERF